MFYQRVAASRASISAGGSGRFQFQWRSVSDNLLMRIEYRWDRDSDNGLGAAGAEDNQSSLNLNLVTSF